MNSQAIKIIDALGGTAEVSRIFDLAMPSVSAWKESGIPKARMMFLEVAYPDALKDVDLAVATSASNADRIPVNEENWAVLRANKDAAETAGAGAEGQG